MIGVIVADDEPIARHDLARLIEQDKDFKVLGEAVTGEQVLELTKKQHPDVLFLDIVMPQMNGLEVAARLSQMENPPLVVFATGFEKYAVQAFEAKAFDYLLKPFPLERLEKTLDRIKLQVRKRESSLRFFGQPTPNFPQKGMMQKLIGYKKFSKDRTILNQDDVFFFHVKQGELYARTADDEFILRSTLRDMMERLNPAKFVQTHKGYVANISKIDKISPLFKGSFSIAMKGISESVPLSQTYASRLRHLID